MLNISKPSKLEKKRQFHLEAAEAKHDYRLRRYGPLRLAGEVWQETLSEKLKKAARARHAARSNEFARGLGFADKDNFEPASSYGNQKSLKQTPDPEGYTIL